MNTKLCIACKEDISIDALKCKHCLQIQTKAANLQNSPYFNYLAIALLGVFIIWIGYYIISFSLTEPLQPSFEIQSSELHLTMNEENLNIRCIAKISNPTLKRWSDFTLQAQFKDINGVVIDVLYSKPQVSIYPNFSFLGMVSGAGSAAHNEYSACELSVVNANDY